MAKRISEKYKHCGRKELKEGEHKVAARFYVKTKLLGEIKAKISPVIEELALFLDDESKKIDDVDVFLVKK